jgi:signal transduction histidine kinase
LKSLAKLRFRLGIRSLLICGTVVIIALLMAVTTVLDVRHQRDTERADLEQRGALLANTLNSVLSGPLRSGDPARLSDYAAAVWAQPDVSYVKIFDASGSYLVGPLANQHPPPGTRDPSVVPLVENLHTKLEWTPDGLRVTTPVTAGAQLVGAVQFGFSTARIDDDIKALTDTRIRQTLLLMGIGIVVTLLLANYVVRPISLLVRVTQRLASGNLGARVEDLRGREMHELGNTFNTMADKLQETFQDLQDSRARMVSADEGARKEIAAHLHGPVQGRLLALRAQLMEVQRRNGISAETAKSLSAISEEMGEVIKNELAVISRRLYPDIVRRGLVPAIQSLCDRFDSVLEPDVRIDEALGAREKVEPQLFREQTRLAAYRITEEALNNIVKHAPDGPVVVQVGPLRDGWLSLSISDSGPGFDVEHAVQGMGLTAMQDQAGAIGGTWSIESRLGRGTTVVAMLPAPEGENEAAIL